MVILTLNCGSSSAKYQVYDWDNKEVLASGVVERVTADGSSITHKAHGSKKEIKSPCPTHKEAIELILKTITDKDTGVIDSLDKIGAVGHRIVHGGDKFTKSVIITPEVIETIRSVQDLGPLHNPANIIGVEAAQKVLPNVPHCAILDTAWHQTMTETAFMYAVPREWYTKYSVRRYGFHGTSFLYTAKRAAVLLGKKPSETNVIICHLGNGASMCAVKDGVCCDTTMGLTPLEGLVMGTRSGDIDPALPFYMIRKTGMSVDEIDSALNKKSGLLGITGGKFSDARDIEGGIDKGDALCKLALDMVGFRIKKYIGAFKALLGRVDAVVFTAGIGENSSMFRAAAAGGLDDIGIKLCPDRNKLARGGNMEVFINRDDSPTKIFVIPTDEELVMTEDAYALMKGTYDVHTKFEYSFQRADYVNKARAAAAKADIEKNPELAKIQALPKK